MHCHSTLGIHEVLEGKYLMSAETPDVYILLDRFLASEPIIPRYSAFEV